MDSATKASAMSWKWDT